MAEVRFEKVKKIYPDGTLAVKELSLEIADGELMVFVGPSGCGKTTALRMVAGLEQISEGDIRIGNEVVNALPPRDRDVAMVFQNYALYPHKSVYENLAFPLKLRKLRSAQIDESVHRIARLLELEEHLERRPRQLSGGQRQRVAMGRGEISLLHRELAITTIFVTHDQIEAMTLGQRVAVMRKGELQQVATPQDLYDNPANIFVAGFIGSPATNFFEGRLEESRGGSYAVVVGEQRLEVDDREAASFGRIGDHVGRSLILGVRPEHLEDVVLAPGTPDGRRLKGRVRLREALGSEVVVHFQVEAAPAVSDELRELAEDVDEGALLDELDHERRMRRTAFVGRFGVGTRVVEGEEFEVAIAPGAIRFFDPVEGVAI